MKTIFMISVILIISSLVILYHDYFLTYSLNNPDITSRGAGFNSPEVSVSSDSQGIKVIGSYMRSPSKEFSHFTYEISESNLYLSAHTKPKSILFERNNSELMVPLSKGVYNVYYMNNDGSKIFIKTVDI